MGSVIVLIQQCIKLVDFSLSVTFTLVLLVVDKARRLNTLRVEPIEIKLEHVCFVVLFFPHLNLQKPADYGPQQH